MKKVKQLLSVLAALVLVVGLSFSNVFAAGDGTITINNAIPGQTYSIYRMLNLTYNDTNKAYSYTVNDKWKSFFYNGEPDNLTETAAKYVTSNNGYIEWKTPAEGVTKESMAADLAKDAIKYATAEATKITPTVSKSAVGTGETTTVEFTGLDLGYYLVDTTTGTLCGLTSTDPHAEVNEKNEKPSVEKTVEENSKPNNFENNKVNDANLGDTVNFRTVIMAQPGGQNYVLHDGMTGLTFKEVTKIAIGTGEKEVVLVEDVDYVVVNPSADPAHKVSENGENCDFEVRFLDPFYEKITEKNTPVYVFYSATVNSDAVIAGPNPNETRLQYGEKNNLWTEPSETKTYVWNVDILKYGKGDETVLLAGAEFEIKNSDETVLQFVEKNVTDKVYRLATPAEIADNTVTKTSTLITDSKGRIYVEGLDAGTYTVTETKAPDGYNKLSTDFTFTVDTKSEDGKTLSAKPIETSQTTNVSATGSTVKVNNTTGSQLPETGGMGTTYLYVIGGLLVAGSAVLMIARKRMSAE